MKYKYELHLWLASNLELHTIVKLVKIVTNHSHAVDTKHYVKAQTHCLLK